MNLPEKLGKNLIGLDFETTGLDIATARIFEIGIVSPDGPGLCVYVNPQCDIPEEVQQLCHLTPEKLRAIRQAPPFEAFADQVLALVHDHTVVGHNVWQYDLPLLAQEMERCGRVLTLARVMVLDTKSLFAKLEPRTLVQAVKYFCGQDHTGAHGAEADAWASLEVLGGMHERIEYLKFDGSRSAAALIPHYAAMGACQSAKELADWGANQRRLDWSGRFVLNEAGVACYGFGKSKGRPVSEDPGFLLWMLGKDFPQDTLRVARQLLQEMEEPEAEEAAA